MRSSAFNSLQLWSLNHPLNHLAGPAINTCFSFLICVTTSMGIFKMLATMSAGVSASHWPNGISATRSALYISIHTKSSVSEVFSM